MFQYGRSFIQVLNLLIFELIPVSFLLDIRISFNSVTYLTFVTHSTAELFDICYSFQYYAYLTFVTHSTV